MSLPNSEARNARLRGVSGFPELGFQPSIVAMVKALLDFQRPSSRVSRDAQPTTSKATDAAIRQVFIGVLVRKLVRKLKKAFNDISHVLHAWESNDVYASAVQFNVHICISCFL